MGRRHRALVSPGSAVVAEEFSAVRDRRLVGGLDHVFHGERGLEHSLELAVEIFLMLGERRAGVEHDHRDAVFLHGRGDDLHLAIQGRLGHAVEDGAGARLLLARQRAVARADRDQLLLLARLHILIEGLRDDQRPLDVDGHHGVEQRVLHVPKALDLPVARARLVVPLARAAVVVDAGVVDEHVDRHVLELRGERDGRVVIGDVELLDAEGFVAGGKIRQRLRCLGPAMRRDHRPAFRRVLLRELEPDARVGAGDHHGLRARKARQRHHREPEQRRPNRIPSPLRRYTNHG